MQPTMKDCSGEAVLVVMLGSNITHETRSRQGSHACDVAVSINYSGGCVVVFRHGQ